MVTQSPAIIFSQQGFMLLVFLDKFCLNKVKGLITRTRWSLCSWSLYHWIFSQFVVTKNLRKLDVYWKNVLQWIPKIIESTSYALTFVFVILRVETCIFSVFVIDQIPSWKEMKDAFSVKLHTKKLCFSLLKIKIKQNLGCPNKE